MRRHRNGRRGSGTYSRRSRGRVTMLLENNPYPQDPRVRAEARSLAAAGYQVEVVAPRVSGQPAREQLDGVSVRRFRTISAPGGSVTKLLAEYAVAFCALHAAALRALCRGEDAIHLHNPPDFLFPAGVIFRLAGRQVVFDHHDLGPELVAVKFGSGVLTALARLSERLTFAVATHVMAANTSHAEIARTRGGMAPAAVTVVRNGPPRGWTEIPSMGRPGVLSPLRLVYVGALAKQDGVEDLPEIVARLREMEPPVPAVLTVIGDGDARGALEAAASRHGVSDAVTITGWVEPSRVRQLIEAADVCLDPAPSTPLNERSTMIKLAEYLAVGKPVVAYDLLESRRTVEDAAVLVEPGDVDAFASAIDLLGRDEERRVGLAKRARERSRQLCWEHSEAALLSAYAALLGPPCPRRTPSSSSAVGAGAPETVDVTARR